jgi:hypothetical protein
LTKNKLKSSEERIDLRNDEEEDDDNYGKNNTTSTPKKNDSYNNVQLNLMNVNEDDYDDENDHNGKFLKYYNENYNENDCEYNFFFIYRNLKKVEMRLFLTLIVLMWMCVHEDF